MERYYIQTFRFLDHHDTTYLDPSDWLNDEYKRRPRQWLWRLYAKIQGLFEEAHHSPPVSSEVIRTLFYHSSLQSFLTWQGIKSGYTESNIVLSIALRTILNTHSLTMCQHLFEHLGLTYPPTSSLEELHTYRDLTFAHVIGQVQDRSYRGHALTILQDSRVINHSTAGFIMKARHGLPGRRLIVHHIQWKCHGDRHSCQTMYSEMIHQLFHEIIIFASQQRCEYIEWCVGWSGILLPWFQNDTRPSLSSWYIPFLPYEYNSTHIRLKKRATCNWFNRSSHPYRAASTLSQLLIITPRSV